MATLAGHLTELDAVNRMLFSIGEAPVSTLESGLGDAAQALSVLRDISRQVQMTGWKSNTKPEVVLTKNSDNQFALPDNILKCDTINPTNTRFRTSGSRPPSKHIDVTLVRSQDDTKWLLLDVANDTELWTSPDTLLVEQILYLDYDILTPPLQHYILARAGREFQKGAMASRILFEFTKDAEDEAQLEAESADEDDEDNNVLRGSPSVRAIAFRRNDLWGM